MALKLASTYKLIDLLARLRAAHQFYWTAHWQTNGPTFAGDHAMFDEFYNGVVPEIDTLAEKLVALSGTEVVDPNTQVAAQAVILKMWTGLPGGLFEKAVAVEASIQDGIDDVMEAMGPSGEMSHGLSNFLEGVADAHEKNSYKLKQRLSPATKVAAAAGTDTASFVVIDPAMLKHVCDKMIEGMTVEDIETLSRQHGAAVIHTEGDGVYDIASPDGPGGDALGYLPPYGEPGRSLNQPDFGKVARQFVARRIAVLSRRSG